VMVDSNDGWISRREKKERQTESPAAQHPGLPSLVHPCHFLSDDTSLKLTSTVSGLASEGSQKQLASFVCPLAVALHS
jgi:hypothetical protein